MHYAQILHDEPTYKRIIPTLTKESVKVDPNDWMNSEAIWSRRFQNTNLKYRYEIIDDKWRCVYE